MPPTGSPRPTDPATTANGRRPSPVLAGVFILAVLLLVAFFAWAVFGPGPCSVQYQEFDRLVQGGHVKKLTFVGGAKIVGEVRDPDAESIKDMKLPGGRFSPSNRTSRTSTASSRTSSRRMSRSTKISSTRTSSRSRSRSKRTRASGSARWSTVSCPC